MAENHPVERMSRGEFIAKYGHTPQPDTIGMVWVADDGKTVTHEVIFTDNKAVDELEALYKLEDPRP